MKLYIYTKKTTLVIIAIIEPFNLMYDKNSKIIPGKTFPIMPVLINIKYILTKFCVI